MEAGREKTADFIFLTKTSYQGGFDFDLKGRLKASVGTKDFNFNEERILNCGKALNDSNVFISHKFLLGNRRFRSRGRFYIFGSSLFF
jgi:site-specific DNA-adenine methylase